MIGITLKKKSKKFFLQRAVVQHSDTHDLKAHLFIVLNSVYVFCSNFLVVKKGDGWVVLLDILIEIGPVYTSPG